MNGGKIPCFIWVVKLHILYDSGAVLGYHVLCVALLDGTDICPCADICAVCAVIDAVSAVLLEPLENSLPCARECGLDGRVGDYHYLSVLQVLKEPFCIVVIISCSGLARLDALAAGNALVRIDFRFSAFKTDCLYRTMANTFIAVGTVCFFETNKFCSTHNLSPGIINFIFFMIFILTQKNDFLDRSHKSFALDSKCIAYPFLSNTNSLFEERSSRYMYPKRLKCLISSGSSISSSAI